MPYISDESILEVQRSIDIYEVVASYIPLKRAGTNYKAHCPFHQEKTPSFIVSPAKQIYKCFGCQKSGSVFSFVMEIEKVDFPEAIKMLAERAGVKLTFVGGGEEEKSIDKNELYRANEWVANYFRRLLLTSKEAEGARNYLGKRGVKGEIVEVFKLGYSSTKWDDLFVNAKAAEHRVEVLLALGLIQKRKDGNGYYDYFRGRLMFPIFDIKSRIIGFGARTLRDDEEPKYLNSPDTPVFSKGSNFYGLNLAREFSEETNSISIVEGYFDVILPYQYGVKGLVATLGTALTQNHIRLLKRYANRITLIYDSDEAGKKASGRSLDMLLWEDIDIFIAKLPEGLDPCDCVIKCGKEEFEKYIQKPIEIFDFLLESVVENIDINTTTGKTKAIEEILMRIATIPNNIKREVLLQQLASRFKIDGQVLHSRISALHKMDYPRQNNSDSTNRKQFTIAEARGTELIEIMLFDNSLIPEVRKQIGLGRMPTETSRKIAGKIFEVFDKYGVVKNEELLSLMRDKESIEIVSGLINNGSKDDKFRSRLNGLIKNISEEYRKGVSIELQIRLKDATARGNRVEVDRILREKEVIWKD